MEQKRFAIFKENILPGSGNFKDVVYYCPKRIPSTFQRMIAIERQSKAIIAASNSYLTDDYFIHGCDEVYEKQYGIYQGLIHSYEKVQSNEINEHINDRIVMISNSFTGTNSGHDLGTLLASILYLREHKLEDQTLGIQELGFQFPRILEILELFSTKWKVFDCELSYHCDSIDFLVVCPRFVLSEYKNPVFLNLVDEIKEKSQFYMGAQGSQPPKGAKIILVKQKHNTNVRVHDSFEGADFFAKMSDAGWIILNPEFHDMRYIICLLMHASHIVVSFGAIQWTHMLFFNPLAQITFFQVGGEAAYHPVSEMKYFSYIIISDTHLDHDVNKNLFRILNPKSAEIRKAELIQKWSKAPKMHKNEEILKLLFSDLLQRQPSTKEWIHHMANFHSRKRMEFLNCDEYQLKCRTRSKRTAILICGQVRHLDVCFPSFQEKILDANAINVLMDVFVVTQDAESIKPRLGHGLVNQYLVTRAPPNLKEIFESKLGSRLKGIQVRETYDQLIASQRRDLTLLNQYGWAETFLDLSLCLDMAQSFAFENNIVYDTYIRVRPDLIFAKEVVLYSMPPNTFVRDKSQFLDAFFICDGVVANIVKDFYSYYIEITKKGQKSLLTTGVFDNIDKCEQSLEQFLIRKKVDFIDGPTMNVSVLGWLISEIKDGSFKRFLALDEQEKMRIETFVSGLTPCIFDIKQCKE